MQLGLEKQGQTCVEMCTSGQNNRDTTRCLLLTMPREPDAVLILLSTLVCG